MPPRKSSPKKSPRKSSPKRSPARKTASTASYVLDEVDVAPSKEIFKVMNMVAYLFVLCALASGIAWIYYTAKANDQDQLGEGSGIVVATATTCFEAAVVSVLLYFVSRHHYHQHF
jgi:hypothetical protein